MIPQPKVMQQMKQLNEHLKEMDLKWLVSDEILVDMHKTKLGEDKDYIVLSIPVTDRTPAQDLANFIESSVHKFADVEVSPATDTKGRYLVYVEMERNPAAMDIIEGILEDCSKLSGIEEWKFKSMGMNSYLPFNTESLGQSVITDPVLYEQQHPTPEIEPNQEPKTDTARESSIDESIRKRFKFLLNY
jgi:hypothetical protein